MMRVVGICLKLLAQTRDTYPEDLASAPKASGAKVRNPRGAEFRKSRAHAQYAADV